MDKEMKELLDSIKTLQDAVAKNNNPEDIKALNEKLDTFEEKNQKLVLAQAEAEKQARELKASQEELKALLEKSETENAERIAELEKEIAMKAAPAADGKAWKNSEEFKSFNEYFKSGERNLDVKTLRTDTDIQGGYLVNPEFAAEILKEMHPVSPLRSFARVRSTSKKSLDIPVRTDLPKARYAGEAKSAPKTGSKYRSETLTAHRQTAEIPVTLDLLQFSDYNVESEYSQDVARSFAIGEGQAFLTGTGNQQPHGILNDDRIARIETAVAGVLSLDDVIKLAAEVKTGYSNLRYFMNKKTLAALRTAKDGNGNYLWRIGGESQPSTINGYPYVIVDEMPDIAVDAEAIMFGDMFSAYMILDSTQMGMIRDEYTHKADAIVETVWHRWNTGQVVMPEALKILKIKA